MNRSDNPDGLKQLLTALADQSEFNKKDLELKANLILTYTSRNNFDEEEAQSQRDTGLKEFTFEENAPQIAKIAR